MKRFFIQTLGCQMNKNDSERIVSLLLSLGLEEVADYKQADLLLVNTCSVRQSAENRVFGLMDKWLKLKEQNPDVILGITGCMAGRDKNGHLRRQFKDVDLFFSIDDLVMLPKWLKELNLEFVKNDFEDLTEYLDIEPKRKNNFQVFISIQTGCNNFCTYCVVPYARGRERNRSVKDILKEVKDAVEAGAIEITLLGQVVNDYKASDKENFSSDNPFKDKDDFSALLWELNQIEKINRIHFTAPDPQYFNDYQISALTLPKQVNFLHLPVQSGDNEVLKRMNRHYTCEKYLEIIKKIKKVKPDMALATDIIVGFCGETQKEFEGTVDLFKQCSFDISYHAVYSQRSGTVAAKVFKDDIPLEEKKSRWRILQGMMEENTLLKNQKYLGKIVEVLVEKYKNGICSGNSREGKLAHFLSSEDLVGQIVKVKITQPQTWVLRGEKI